MQDEKSSWRIRTERNDHLEEGILGLSVVEKYNWPRCNLGKIKWEKWVYTKIINIH